LEEAERFGRMSPDISEEYIAFDTCFYAGIVLGFFNPEDGGDIFLRTVG
jgi:hypothetical protein